MPERTRHVAGLVALACLAGTAFAEPARAIDCDKAKKPDEKALCADPAAKASDDAMATAFTALRAGQPEAARPAALADQRAWLKTRNEACPTPDKPLARCLEQENKDRIAVLTGQPETGPGLTRRPVPVFVRQAAGPDKVEVAVRVYRYPDPQGAAEAALNAVADTALGNVVLKKEVPDPALNVSHSEDWTIRYGSPSFLSIESAGYDFGGGAHGSAATTGVNLNLAAGRVAALSDYFDAKASEAIVEICLKQVETQKAERGAPIDKASLRKRVAEVTDSLGSWIVRADASRIVFNASSIGAYAESEYECILPGARLATLAKGTFPPR